MIIYYKSENIRLSADVWLMTNRAFIYLLIIIGVLYYNEQINNDNVWDDKNISPNYVFIGGVDNKLNNIDCEVEIEYIANSNTSYT